MKVISNLLTAILIILIIFTCTSVKEKQATTDLTGANIRAAKGDTVWVILNHIKPDRCEIFEKFIHDIFWAKSVDLEPADQQTFKQTRVLYPTQMNKDSTYTYVFLMDPVIPQGDYSILNFLKKMYGEDEAKEYYKMFTESLNVPQEWYSGVQSQH